MSSDSRPQYGLPLTLPVLLWLDHTAQVLCGKSEVAPLLSSLVFCDRVLLLFTLFYNFSLFCPRDLNDHVISVEVLDVVLMLCSRGSFLLQELRSDERPDGGLQHE